ncbi:MAG: dihydropteroate synthase [Bacteroidetes bacterium]|nr:dihydropteroate synthase [Bacteroidota bacterium]
MKKYLNIRGKLLDYSGPLVMGILNVTPDSFYDGGKNNTPDDVLNHARKMINEGASIIDIGAQSTRPGAKMLSSSEEWSRLQQPLRLLRKEFPEIVLSVDTFYSEIAEKAAGEGIDIINDISGGNMDKQMFSIAGKLKLPYVLMHIQGTPQTMQQSPSYNDVTSEVIDHLSGKIMQLIEAGVNDIIIDPGFGFGKTPEHNFGLLSNLGLFKIFERPILVGLSRKSMVTKVAGITPENALNGTTVLNTIALQKGANILRVHDVKEAMEAIKLTAKISNC